MKSSLHTIRAWNRKLVPVTQASIRNRPWRARLPGLMVVKKVVKTHESTSAVAIENS